MVFAFGSNHNSPVQVGSQDDGWIVVQVRSGSSVWIAQTQQALLDLRSVDGSLILNGDAIKVSPGDGIVYLPWTGPLWAFNPQADIETVFGVILMMGCSG